MASPTVAKSERVFRLFISYAREDDKIAIAVNNALQMALGKSAKVFIDTQLQYGLNFEDEICKKLEETDALVVIDSNTLKPPFGWTGAELGRFMHVMDNDPTGRDFKRRVIPVYAEKPSDVLARHQGIRFGIQNSTLSAAPKEYEATLEDLGWQHPTVRFLLDLQSDVDRLLKTANGEQIPHSKEQDDLPGVVREMQQAIFTYLRTTPESTLKPQKQITIRTNAEALDAKDGALPDDALLIPVGNGMPMSIFGIDSVEMDWGEFQRQTQKFKFRDSWVDAITSVVTSSKELEIDNSQVIVSNDETHTYRVILTTGTKYYDGVREYNLYFVEYLGRRDFGDRETTLLLKSLNLFCRFRFMFLEGTSEFSSLNCGTARNLRDFARDMERELNLLHRDAQELGLDKPSNLVPFVDKSHILAMATVWRPLEMQIRGLLSQIRSAQSDGEQFRSSLVAALSDLETKMHPLSAEAISEMAEKLKRPATDS